MEVFNTEYIKQSSIYRWIKSSIEGQLYESTVKENGVSVYKLTVNCSNKFVSEQDVNTGKIYNYPVLEL